MDVNAEPPADKHLSPGFRANADTAAYELKFLIPAAKVEAILAQVHQHMVLDPHCDPQLGHAYEVHGLYFDTEEFHVYHRQGSHAVHKLRMRRYGATGGLYLEHKMKSGGRVRKRRSALNEAELGHLSAPRSPADWDGMWFRRRMKSRKVRPVCEVSYLRQAFTGGVNGDMYRLTIDRSLRCRPFGNWNVRGVDCGDLLLTDEVVLEMKYCEIMPGFFKGLLADFQLAPGRFSKYRLSVEACGLAPPLIVPAVDPQSDGSSGDALSRTA